MIGKTQVEEGDGAGGQGGKPKLEVLKIGALKPSSVDSPHGISLVFSFQSP